VVRKPEYVTIEPGDKPVIDTLLTAGDALYIPRGCAHSAVAVHDMSLHLSIGIVQASLRDLLKYMLDSPAMAPVLDAALPAGFAKDASALTTLLAERQQSMLQPLNDADTAREIVQGFTRHWYQEARHDQKGLITETIAMLRG
jgi:ribosomal protein L16 Arg81 hydroxylase